MLTELQKQVEQQQEMLEAQDRRLGDQDQRLEVQERRICCGCKDGHRSHGNRESHQSGNTGTDQRRRPEDLYRGRLQEQRRHAQAAARLWTIPGLKSQQTIDGPGGGSGAASSDSVFGWGVTMGGRKDLQWSDYGSAILGQITYGRGIGRCPGTQPTPEWFAGGDGSSRRKSMGLIPPMRRNMRVKCAGSS